VYCYNHSFDGNAITFSLRRAQLTRGRNSAHYQQPVLQLLSYVQNETEMLPKGITRLRCCELERVVELRVDSNSVHSVARHKYHDYTTTTSSHGPHWLPSSRVSSCKGAAIKIK